MVKADEILKLSKHMRERREKRKASSPNTRRDKRLENVKRQYLSRKGDKIEMMRRNIEEARDREMAKLRNELNGVKGVMSHSQKVLNRMIRSAKRSVRA